MKQLKSNIFSVLFVISSLFVNDSIYAGVDSDLNSFFDKLGFDSNITKPRAHKGQEAGYYTGGSIFARTPVRDLQIAQVELPGYRSGCGGIDLFAGGFSFINSEQLVTMMKNILNNAQGYAFTLALESATPLLANAIKYLQELAAKINAMNVNSCETSAALVGSVWPRTQEAQRRVCADIGSKGIFRDYADAKQKCGAEGQLSKTLNQGSGAHKNLVFKEGNLAWKAIKQNAFLSSDQELAELFMSLSGTIIVRQKSGEPQKGETHDNLDNSFETKPSLATNMDLLNALLNGGKAKLYKCDTDAECLNPTTTSIDIKAEHNLKTKVGELLQKLAVKFYADTRLTGTDIGLMEATTLPIQKMLNVQMAFYKDHTILDISSYTDIIAVDILFQYLNESLNVVRASATSLQYPESIMSEFIDGIDAARRSLRGVQRSVYAELTTTNSITRQTKVIEDLLASSFSEHMNLTMKWSKGEL